MSTDLREKLRRALGSSRPATASADAETIAHSERPVETGRSLGIQHLVPGRVVQGRSGECFIAERTYDLAYVHGGEPLGGFLVLADRAVACLNRDAATERLDPREVLFLDTETTGLSGGTGTYVFMVGLGFFDADRFVIRQYFMRHHAEEPAMLAELNALFPRFRTLVSFNGKAFDQPLLETRFIAGRQRPALRTAVHLDLLFPARRLWHGRLESCSLGSIERSILGHLRRRDVPSWMIPELYFRYVRGGDVRPMARVFDHNLDDVLSLVALASRLGRLLGDPLAIEADADDLFAVARVYEDLGYWDDACACYERALACCDADESRTKVATRLARLCKRTGRPDRAIELWRRLARSGGTASYVELAKHYEWVARDYAAAVAIVEQALTVVQLGEARGVSSLRLERVGLERRLARLLVKRRRGVRSSPASVRGEERVRAGD